VAATTIEHTDQGFVIVAGDHGIGFTPASWMSASIVSFGMAAAVTVAVGPLSRRRRP
jgi:hypothetical protein